MPSYPLPVLRLARLGVDLRAQGLGGIALAIRTDRWVLVQDRRTTVALTLGAIGWIQA